MILKNQYCFPFKYFFIQQESYSVLGVLFSKKDLVGKQRNHDCGNSLTLVSVRKN